MSVCALGVLVCWALVFTSTGWAQGSGANVNEGLETTSYWVDVNNGSDSNPGTQSQPFKTIAYAAAVAEANTASGTKVTINPGIYREAIGLSTTGQSTTFPITLEAATTATAILNGADIFTGWQPYSGNAKIYTNAWPYQYGLCSSDTGGAPFEQDIVLRREMVIVTPNGGTPMPLTQVLSLAQMQQGTVYVDEAGGTIYIWPANGTNLNTATVEVATRPNLISISNTSQIVLRGLTFQYANSCRTDAAVPVYNSNNILIDSDFFYWNNAQGVALTADRNTTVQNTIANHNGQGGISGYQTLQGVWSGNTTNFNNWRGSQGAYYLWSSAGFHPYANHDDTVAGHTSIFNQTFGVHFDTDNMNIVASGMVLSENLLAEGFVEKSEGPITISSSYMCNGNPVTGPNSIGFEARNSENITLSGDLIADDNSELTIFGVAGGILVTNWQTGQVYNLVTKNMSNTGNTIVGNTLGSTPPEALFYDGSLDGADWAMFASSFTSNNNTYWSPVLSTPFTVPVPNPFTELSFSGWQGLGFDLNSTFTQPTGNYLAPCTLNADSAEFWLVQNALATLQPILSGGTASFEDTVTPILGFNGTVTLTADGVQNIPGATGSWSNNTITGGSGTATYTVTTSASTPTGVYPITMIANSGSITKTTVGSLLVNTNVAIDPLIANLGGVDVGSPSPAFTATVVNVSSTTPLAISNVTTSGDFAQTNTCGTLLAAASSCAITITFTPTAVGTRTGTLTITDVDGGSPQKVSLTGMGVGVPIVSLSPTSLTFPNTNVGSSSAPMNVTLTNTGTATLLISSISITGLNVTDFSQTNTCGTSVDIGASCTISVSFVPQVTGPRSAMVSISDNAGTVPQSVSLSGTGTAPVVSLNPTSLNFGSVPLGSNKSLPVTLKNTGTGTLTISSISFTGTDPGDYSQTNTCGGSVQVGASCTITVTFTPQALGPRPGIMQIFDNALNSPQGVNLSGSGSGPQVKLQPNAINFGSVPVGMKSAAKTVTLTNSGTADLIISSITIGGSDPQDFAQTNNCPGTVPPSGSCTISVTFMPTTTGTRTGTVSIADNASNSPQTVSLTGKGTSAGGVTLTPNSLTFTTQLVGAASRPQKITVKNTGTTAVTINSITITGPNAADFSQTNTCPTSLGGGMTCAITVTFKPIGSGTRTASVNVTDSDGTQTASLTGTGTVVSLMPAVLNFPTTAIGHSSAAKTVTMKNVGTTSISITGITITGTNPGDFAQTNTCGSSLGAGASCTISVTFTPTASGTRSATVSISDTGGGSPQTVPLTGTGTTVFLSPTVLNFPSTGVGHSSAAKTVTLTNVGTTALTITSVTIIGTNPNDFSQTSTCGSSVAGGASCTFSVVFSPTATGARSATLSISDSGVGSPHIVALGGTGM
ncbi:MAG: choice-of-anchor D domain-containing protein [Acidobacteriia bacterium]|nr:choice-of-anchor D domain-containing protein [Terriglobia bacterium]